MFPILTVGLGAAAGPLDGVSCVHALHARRSGGIRIPFRGEEPARSLRVRSGNTEYRVTIALRKAGEQRSPVIIQMIFPRVRDPEMERFILDRLLAQFKSAEISDETGAFLRLLAPEMDRAGFSMAVEGVNRELHRRFSSSARIHPSVSLVARGSPAVADAVRMMAGYLRRTRTVASEKMIDRILNRAHALLIKSLSERELRFFDYSLFDEIMSYEQDQRMKELAAQVREFAHPEDSDYEKIHADTRAKFLSAVRTVLEVQSRNDRSVLDDSQAMLDDLVKVGESLLAKAGPKAQSVDAVAGFPDLRVPFSISGFAKLADHVHSARLTLEDVDSLKEMVSAANIGSPAVLPHWWSASDEVKADVARMNWLALTALRSLTLISRQLQAEIANDPMTLDEGNLLTTNLSQIPAGDGGLQGGASFKDINSDLPRSFLHQPRRLNSGNGNRRERFEWDTPEFD